MKSIDTAESSEKFSTKSNAVLERNYEEDCPSLYEALEAATTEADFDRILKYLETGRWEGLLFSSEGSSPIDQTKTWVTRFDINDSNKVMWSQLPLHLAIVCNAPLSIVKALVKLNPQALRCTDDQHMLPLHLALRQGASDEVVAFLALEFPEAVNAKGKNGRTAVECSQRAKHKERGMILEVFVERTKSKMCAAVYNEKAVFQATIDSQSKEIKTIKSQLEAQYSVAEKLRSNLANATAELERTRTEKKAIEASIVKVQELENSHAESDAKAKEQIDKLRGAKVVETLELQKKVEELEANQKEMNEMQRKARQVEASLRKELEFMQEKVASSFTPEDWNNLKSEIDSFQAERLKSGLNEAQSEIDTLKDELEKTLNEAKLVKSKNIKLKNDLRSELKSIKKSVDLLQADEASVKSSSDLQALRNEVKNLRAAMKSRAEASKTKLELAVLKKAMEVELRNAEGKTQGELEALRKAVKLANEQDLDSKTAAELAALRVDFQLLKNELNEKELESTVKKDVDEIRTALKSALNTADPKTKVELLVLKEKVDDLYSQSMVTQPKEGMIAIKKDVESLKDAVKKAEISAKINEEAAVLKQIIDEELPKSQGKTQQELLQIKQAIESLIDKGLQNKDTEELVKIKNELGSLKNELKGVEEAIKTQVELVELKKNLELQLHNATGNTEKELAEMKRAVNAINLASKESKKLKKFLSEEIKTANSKTEKELIEVKKALHSINVSKLETKSKSEWDTIRTEMESLKKELQEKQVAQMSEAEQELRLMKKVVEAINIKELENKSETEFGAIRKEMDDIKAELKEKEGGDVALKIAIKDLKEQAKTASVLPPKKDKAGIKKFLARRFSSRKGSSSINVLDSSDIVGTAMISAEEKSISIQRAPLGNEDFSTIMPPSLFNNPRFVGTTSSSDSDGPSVLASQSAMLKRNETKKAAAAVTPMLLPPSGATKLTVTNENKVSMTSATPSAYTMRRTTSKTHIKANGEVELEAVDEAVVPSSLSVMPVSTL